MTFALLSPRAADQFILADTSLVNLGAPVASSLALPAGWGDSLLLDCHVIVNSIATMMTAPETSGVCIRIVDSQGASADYMGCARWHQTATDVLQATIDPDQVRYLRGDEQIRVEFAEVDTNASATADCFVFIRVRRIRQEGPKRNEERLLGRIVLAT